MSLNGKRHCSERAKKLRSILRDHYVREDMTMSVEMLLADVRHLCDQRSIDFNQADKAAYDAYSVDRVEARK